MPFLKSQIHETVVGIFLIYQDETNSTRAEFGTLSIMPMLN